MHEVFYVLAGDLLQGSPIDTVFKGVCFSEIVGLKLLIDFYYGTDKFLESSENNFTCFENNSCRKLVVLVIMKSTMVFLTYFGWKKYFL